MQFVQVYARYVADISSIVKKSEIPNILQQLNSYHNEIQFTYEIMNNNQLPFLDCMIDIKEDFSLGFFFPFIVNLPVQINFWISIPTILHVTNFR